MVWAGHDVRDDFRLLRIRDARLEYADYGCRAIARHAEANSLADNRWISFEGVRPETIGEDDDAGSRRALISRPDEAPEKRDEDPSLRNTSHRLWQRSLREARRGRSG